MKSFRASLRTFKVRNVLAFAVLFLMARGVGILRVVENKQLIENNHTLKTLERLKWASVCTWCLHESIAAS